MSASKRCLLLFAGISLFCWIQPSSSSQFVDTTIVSSFFGGFFGSACVSIEQTTTSWEADLEFEDSVEEIAVLREGVTHEKMSNYLYKLSWNGRVEPDSFCFEFAGWMPGDKGAEGRLKVTNLVTA